MCVLELQDWLIQFAWHWKKKKLILSCMYAWWKKTESSIDVILFVCFSSSLNFFFDFFNALILSINFTLSSCEEAKWWICFFDRPRQHTIHTYIHTSKVNFETFFQLVETRWEVRERRMKKCMYVCVHFLRCCHWCTTKECS